MTFAAPLGLLAFAALPVVIALHLFRNRLPERRVAGLFLYPGTALSSDGGRRRARVLRSPSFWLECTMAVLLALWLGGPSFAALQQRHLVVVLDDSASMAAHATLPQARATLRWLAEEHQGGLAALDQVTVVCTGAVPRVVVGPRADAAALAAFREAWLPQQPGTAPTAALDLARQLAGERGELWFVTDGEPGAPLADVHVRACGAPADNAALVSVRREPHASGERLRVLLVGHAVGDGAMQRTLRISDGGVELASASLALSHDGAPVEVVLPLSGSAAQLRVELLVPSGGPGTADALAIDDVAQVVAVPTVEVAVCDQLPAELRRELQLDRVFAALPGWRAETQPARASLLLRDAPAALQAGQLEVIVAPTGGRRGGYTSPFVVDRSHPLLAGAAFEGVAWAAGGGDLAGQVLVASGAKVLLAEQSPDQGRRLWFDLDAGAGNLTRAPDWPVLWANVLELAARDAPGCARHQVRVGDEIAFRGDGQRSAVLVGPDGVACARGADVLSTIAALPGIYEVRADTAADPAHGSAAVLAAIAANFVDASESDLRQRSAFDRPPGASSTAAVATAVDPRPLRRWLSLLLLLVVVADWWWLARGAGGGRA